MLSRHIVGTYQGNELTRISPRNARLLSSELAEPPWTDPGLKVGIGAHTLISTKGEKKEKKSKKKKRRRGLNCRTFPQIIACAE